MSNDDLITHSVRHVERLGIGDAGPSMQLAHHLMMARNLYAKYIDNVLGRAGIKSGEADVLMAIRVRDFTQTTPKDLASQFVLTSAAITKRLDLLERKGLLVRIRHQSDRRSVTLALTKEGRTNADQVIEIKAAALKRLTSRSFKATELVDLYNGLERLIVGLNRQL